MQFLKFSPCYEHGNKTNNSFYEASTQSMLNKHMPKADDHSAQLEETYERQYGQVGKIKIEVWGKE